MIKNIENILKEICIQHFDINNNWYNWRKVNETIKSLQQSFKGKIKIGH